MRKYFSSKLHPPSAMQEGAVHMTPAQEKAFKLEGLRVVLGGVLIHFVLGTFYLWGGISVYVASYLKSYTPSADIDTVKMVFPLMFIGINAMLSLGVKLAAKIGHRLICFLGIVCISVASLIVSWITNFWLFIIVYTVMIGLASGMVYMVPVVCGWKYFPKKKGEISGAIIAGYGLGSFTFNLIALHIVNPENKVASVVIDGHSYFTEDVYSKVPDMFRIFALMYIIIGTVGCLLVKMPKTVPTEHQEEHNVLVKADQKNSSKQGAERHEHQDADTIKEGVMTRSFWILFGMVLCGSFFGLLQANNYKVYGLTRIHDDSFITLTGSVGSAVNGCSRFIWATLYDKIGYRKTYVLLMGLQTIAAATIDSVAGTKILFLIWHSCIMACEGGQFSVMPPTTTRVFGPKIGPVIYGVLYIGFSIANLSAFFLTKFGGDSISWKTIFWICFALSAAAFVINFLFNENADITYKNRPATHELMRIPGSPTAHDDHDHDHDHDDHSHDHDHDLEHH